MQKTKLLFMRFLFFILLCLANKTATAQDTIRLDSKSFHEITRDAAGRGIVYAQRKVQLKKKGLYKVKTEEGEAIFSLDKNGYLNGYFHSRNSRGAVVESRYISGIAVYTEEHFGERKIIKRLAVTKKGTDYFITHTKVSFRDSVVEKYKNHERQLKEKWAYGKLVFQNNKAENTAVFYDGAGRLTEKHVAGTEEKYRSTGEVYYKRVYVKGRIEEYRDGMLFRLSEEKKDTAGRTIWSVSDFDEKGILLRAQEEEGFGVQAAPEYMIFDLNKRELESYKVLAGRK